ncbi:hypothetical protein [Herbiconiux daphne]|uniref:Uncharacterized protein n=1 Tax=Herbiconiux daphne TaxID=2970914 RepID=A0ABT2H6E6_9MICO|nr:hypothetical protein [Herbiconiux daphne]MCS5735517.1 hypothetical protein [Herbiconiux daphne]
MSARDRENGRKGGMKRWQGSTPAERRERAAELNRIRWERYRAEQAAKAAEEQAHEPTDELMPFWLKVGETWPELSPADRLEQARYLRRRWLNEGGDGA